MTAERLSSNNSLSREVSSELDLIQRIEKNGGNNTRDKKSGYSPSVSEWDLTSSHEEDLDDDTRHVAAQSELTASKTPVSETQLSTVEHIIQEKSDPNLFLSSSTPTVSADLVLNMNLIAGSLSTEKVPPAPVMQTVQADETLDAHEKPLLQLQEAFANLALQTQVSSAEIPATLPTISKDSVESSSSPPNLPNPPKNGFSYPPIPQLPKPWDEMTTDERMNFVKDCLSWINKASAVNDQAISYFGRFGLVGGDLKNFRDSLNQAKIAYECLLEALENPYKGIDPFKDFNFNWSWWNAKIPKIEPGKAPTMGESARMAEVLAEILTQLAQILGIAGKGRSEGQKTLTDGAVIQNKMLVKIASDTIVRLIDKLEQAEKAASASRIFRIIASVFVAIGAIASGQFQIAGLTITLLALSETGKLQEGIEALASALNERFDLGKDTSKLLSTLTFIIGTALVSGGGALGTMATLAITAQYTDLIAAITPFLDHLSNDEKLAIQVVLQVVLALMAVIGSCGGSPIGATGSTLAKVASLVGRIAQIAGSISQAGQSSAQIEKGQIGMDMAAIQESLSSTQALTDFFNKLSQILTTQFKGDDKHMGEEVNALLQGVNELLQSRKEADATLAGILGRAEIRA